MKDFLRYQQRMFVLSIAVCTAVAVGLLIMLPDRLEIAQGVALGAVAGLIKFRLDVLALLKLASEMEQGGPARGVRTAFHTYLLMAGALLLGVAYPEYAEPWAIFGGLLIPRAVLILDGLLRPGALQASGSEEQTAPTGGAAE